MDDGTALLAAIRLHPDEDVPRLAYADWLDEHNFADRAEFIRVQCELGRWPEWSLEYKRLDDRAKVLFEQIRPELEAEMPIAQPIIYEHFKRGFLDTILIGMKAFMERGEELLTNTVARTIDITDSQGVLSADEVRNCPVWQKVHGLRFVEWPYTEGGGEEQYWLAAVRAATNLKHLSVGHMHADVNDADIRDLVNIPHIGRLESLALCQLLDIGLIPLARSSRLPGLKKLDLSGCILHRVVSPQFFRARGYKLGQLEQLTIGSSVMDPEDITPALEVHGGTLKSLSIVGYESEQYSAVMDVLARYGTPLALQKLIFDGSCSFLCKDDLKALARATHLPELTQFAFTGQQEHKSKPDLEKYFLETLFAA